MERDRKKEKASRLVNPGIIFKPANYSNVKKYIRELEEDGATHMYKFKKEPKNTASMEIYNVYMLENFSSRIAAMKKVDLYTQDLMMLIWLRDYEYVSRSYITKTLGFPSHYSSYKFMKRNVDNGYVKVIRTRHVGVHNGSAFYLTKKGENLAKQVYDALRVGNWNEWEH